MNIKFTGFISHQEINTLSSSGLEVLTEMIRKGEVEISDKGYHLVQEINPEPGVPELMERVLSTMHSTGQEYINTWYLVGLWKVIYPRAEVILHKLEVAGALLRDTVVDEKSKEKKIRYKVNPQWGAQ